MDKWDKKADATDRQFNKIRADRPEQTDTRTKAQVAFMKPMGPLTVGEEDARGGYNNTTSPVGVSMPKPQTKGQGSIGRGSGIDQSY